MRNRCKLLLCICALLGLILSGCSSDANEMYVPISGDIPTANVNLSEVPYSKLSDYKFFEGDLKAHIPIFGVIPYAPASSLFSDYAEKKRFIWLPQGTKATYDGDGKILQLPIGAALIKTFFYNNVQPSNTRRIVETRVMIRKSSGWIFAEYVWNDEQTDAYLQMDGSNTEISWATNSGEIKSTNYRIPSENECFRCHKTNLEAFPIGIKPQNLNTTFNYPEGSKNQLQKLVESGYLENNLPSEIVSVVNYNDTSKPIGLRARSYFDSNCAHCHQDGGEAEFYSMRFAFNKTNILANMGVCQNPNHVVPGFEGRIVAPGNPEGSVLYYRMTINDFYFQMPQIGRTIIHEEGVALVADWINSISDCE